VTRGAVQRASLRRTVAIGSKMPLKVSSFTFCSEQRERLEGLVLEASWSILSSAELPVFFPTVMSQGSTQ
jgi:hypothetical protein